MTDAMATAEYDMMARVEDGYWWYRDLRRRVTTSLHAALGAAPQRILDVGCGTGANARALRAAFPSSVIVGTDIAPRALAHSRARGVGPLVRASANELPFRGGTFDAALITDVLNVAAVDDAVALREAHRVLRAGGVLAANVPAFEWLRGTHDAAVNTARRYRRRELGRLLGAAGFAVGRVVYWNALLLPVAFVMRRARRGARGSRPVSDLAPLPHAIDSALGGVLAVERRLAGWMPLPFGTSLFAVATKRA
jgi:SAM-dependent methyltransferase